MANWEQLNFQNRNNPVIEQLIFLHDHIIRILILIITLVIYIIIILITAKKNIVVKENHNLEILWTFLPGVILLLIAFPSLRLLYITEESENPTLTIKILGHQWYWSYEYSNFYELEFDSFIKPSSDINLRLLETDNAIFIPFNSFITLFISSSDVLHSWTIPALGVKVDASPGRLNNISLFTYKPGLYFGQCSEICGTNHRFIPIILFISNHAIFKNWIKLNSSTNKNWTFNSKTQKTCFVDKNFNLKKIISCQDINDAIKF